jgi:16S rRNA (cytosine967-C5)-methyltransferase
LKVPRLDVTQDTFSSELFNRYCSFYSEQRAQAIIDSLSKPVKKFAIRVNISLISREETRSLFEVKGWKTACHPLMEEVILIDTKGPMSVPYLPNAPLVVADKIASESVLVGAPLYAVGIKKKQKFRKNQEISIVSPKYQIVATGITRINSKSKKKTGTAIENSHSFFQVPSLRVVGVYSNGFSTSQSLPAIYVSHVLDPKPDETIVDLCAAPGGKSTSAALLSNDKANIIAFDRSHHRLLKMEKELQRLKISNVKTINANSLKYLKNHTIKADKVIVDPSCSATGVRPKVYELTTEKEIESVSNYQKAFLWTANKIVRPGGIITYSTCSMEREENEKNIAYAVNELGLQLISPEKLLGSEGENTNDGLELECMRRFYPDVHGTPGFFVAKLMKKE